MFAFSKIVSYLYAKSKCDTPMTHTPDVKISKFSSVIPLSENYTLLYSALSDKFVAVRREWGEAISRKELTAIPDKVFSDLMSAGVLCDSRTDEDATLADMIESADGDSSTLQITVNPTLGCNFHCWYCYENHIPGSKMSAETVESIQKYLDNYLHEHPETKYFTLSFFGGEPLLYFKDNVLPLIEGCGLICRSAGVEMQTHFTTNGFLLRPEIAGFLSAYHCSFQITLDGAREFHDRTRCGTDGKGSFDEIMANIRHATEAGCSVLVRVNYTSENIGSIPEIITLLAGFPDDCKRFLRMDLQRVWQDSDAKNDDNVISTISADVALARQHGITATSHYVQDYVRNSCYGDKHNYVLVNYNGDVYKCTARDFARIPALGKLTADGRIIWSDNGYLEKRRKVKFSRRACHECRIAPLCSGGCRQKAMEYYGEDKCLYDRTEEDKDRIVLNRFEFYFLETN